MFISRASGATVEGLSAAITSWIGHHLTGAFGNVVRMLVPLVATDEQIAEGLRILDEAIAEVQAKLQNWKAGRST